MFDQAVGLLLIVAGFTVWIVTAVRRALNGAWAVPEDSAWDELDRPGLDTPAKREAALRYLDTLEGMTSDPVLLDRIARQRSMLRHPAGGAL